VWSADKGCVPPLRDRKNESHLSIESLTLEARQLPQSLVRMNPELPDDTAREANSCAVYRCVSVLMSWKQRNSKFFEKFSKMLMSIFFVSVFVSVLENAIGRKLSISDGIATCCSVYPKGCIEISMHKFRWQVHTCVII
jgi:hypothetical protein